MIRIRLLQEGTKENQHLQRVQKYFLKWRFRVHPYQRGSGYEQINCLLYIITQCDFLSYFTIWMNWFVVETSLLLFFCIYTELCITSLDLCWRDLTTLKYGKGVMRKCIQRDFSQKNELHACLLEKTAGIKISFYKKSGDIFTIRQHRERAEH